jgi:hypothetical protein
LKAAKIKEEGKLVIKLLILELNEKKRPLFKK